MLPAMLMQFSGQIQQTEQFFFFFNFDLSCFLLLLYSTFKLTYTGGTLSLFSGLCFVVITYFDRFWLNVEKQIIFSTVCSTHLVLCLVNLPCCIFPLSLYFT